MPTKKTMMKRPTQVTKVRSKSGKAEGSRSAGAETPAERKKRLLEEEKGMKARKR